MRSIFIIVLFLSWLAPITNAWAQAPNWAAPEGYQYSMTVTAVLDFSGVESTNTNDMVAAFVGGQVRGVAQPVYEAVSDRHYVFMTVFSNVVSGESVSFQLYNADSDESLLAVNTLTFENNAVVKTIAAPLRISNNSFPTSLSLADLSVNENEISGTVMIGIIIEDLDADETFNFTLVSGEGSGDNSLFEVLDEQLVLNATLDHESQSTLSIRLRATDSKLATLEETFEISVVDSNDTPTEINIAQEVDVREDTPISTTLGLLSTVDQDDGDTFVYALVGGDGDEDNALLSISGAELRLLEAPNFESNPMLSFRLSTTDAQGASHEQAFAWAVADVNEAPTTITLEDFNRVNLPTLNGLVGKLSTGDEDGGEGHDYLLVDGTGANDNADFYIEGAELLSLGTFDITSNRLRVRVKSTDQSGLSFEQAIAVAVAAQPEIELSTTTLPENQSTGSFALALSTDNSDGESFTYALVSGEGDTNNALFTIEDDTLRYQSIINFEESPQLSIRLRSTDNNDIAVASTFTLNVTDTNDEPTDITVSELTVRENSQPNTILGTINTIDEDTNDSYVYSLISGDGDADNALFSISGNVLRAASPVDYESQQELSGRIKSTDAAGATVERSFTWQVDNINEAPSSVQIISLEASNTALLGEIVLQLVSTDEDANDSHSYELVTGEGDDHNTDFYIQGDELRSLGTFDTMLGNILIRVKSQDAGQLSIVQALTVVLAPEPRIVLSSTSVNENKTIGEAALSFGMINTNGSDFTYALVPGEGSNDNALFSIDGDTLRYAAVLDYESKPSLTIRVKASDSTGESVEMPLTIDVSDGNDAPIAIVLVTPSIPENQSIGTVASLLSAQDEDAQDVHSFALVAGAGDDYNALFTVDNDRLVIAGAVDFETSALVSIRLSAMDAGGLTTETSILLEVTDENDPPSDIIFNELTTEDLSEVGQVLAVLSTVDQDAGDAHTYQLVEGQGDDFNEHFFIRNNEVVSLGTAGFRADELLSLRIKSIDQGLEEVEKVVTGEIILSAEDVVSFNVFPNPTSDYLFVTSSIPVNSMNLYDTEGRLVKSNHWKHSMDIRGIKSGLYLLTIAQGSESINQIKVLIR